jgi:hypothetical protein
MFWTVKRGMPNLEELFRDDFIGDLDKTLQQRPHSVEEMLDDQNALNQRHILWKSLLLPCQNNFTPRSRIIEHLRKCCP